MKQREFIKGNVLIIIADEGKYLALKNIENSESIIGKPSRMTFENAGMIPEFEEREVIE